jgi:hypothetical protein
MERAKPWWHSLQIYCGSVDCGFHCTGHDASQISTNGQIENGNNLAVEVKACSAHLLRKPLLINTEDNTCNLMIPPIPGWKLLNYLRDRGLIE